VIDENNMFGYQGVLDRKTHYVPAIGMFDHFWALRTPTRNKILEGWITTLQTILENEEFEPDEIVGNVLMFSNEDVKEEKETDNVVQFPSITRSL
jgi:hypothetical protein